MAKHIVAVVGRPNVGKSTFVNRIAQADEAIVHAMRGVTRDRSYHEADWNGVPFTLIDTGGIEMGNEDAFQGSIRNQAFSAADECDVIIFLVDGKTGINADDEEVARILRRSKTPVILAVNKMDNPAKDEAIYEFYNLGLGDPGRYPLFTAPVRETCSTIWWTFCTRCPNVRRTTKMLSTWLSSGVRMRANPR